MGHLKKEVLITGGTSGLGKSLVRQFLENGHEVTALGRSASANTEAHPRLRMQNCDFAKLEGIHQLVDVFASRKRPFDLLVNNAGILSPPDYRETVDGFELTYQVNFLSHVLLTHLLLRRELLRPGLVINISSPIYSRGNLNINLAIDKNHYSALRAYTNSKLYMAMLSEKLANDGISGFGFNPGTFSSAIYRMQKKWFHMMYKVAAPFMVSSDKVAESLAHIIHENKWQDGWMVDRKGGKRMLNSFDADEKTTFWEKVDEQLKPYIS